MAGINVFGRKRGNPQMIIIVMIITLLVGVGVYMLLNTEEENSNISNVTTTTVFSNVLSYSSTTDDDDDDDESQTTVFESSSETTPATSGIVSFFNSIIPNIVVGTAPSNCVLGEWEDASVCDGGWKTQERRVRIKSKNGGTCPEPFFGKEDFVETKEIECPLDCEGYWSETLTPAECPVTCGGGKRTRDWITTVERNHLGRTCEERYGGGAGQAKEEPCGTNPCPVHCQGYYDENWSDCSKSCGGGTKTKNWNTTVHPAHGGNACPASQISEKCNEHACCNPWIRQDPQPVVKTWSECADASAGGGPGAERSLTIPTCVKQKAIGQKGCEQRDNFDIVRENGFCELDLKTWSALNKQASCTGSFEPTVTDIHHYVQPDLPPAHGTQ